MEYEYKENIIKELIKANTNSFYGLNNKIDNNMLPDGSKITKTYLKRLFDNNIKNKCYLINVNPSGNLTFLCYEVDNRITYFSLFDTSRNILRSLKKDYNKLPIDLLNVYSFEYFINNIPYYKESKKLSEYILLSDYTIFDNKKLEFNKISDELPSYLSDVAVTDIKGSELQLLDNIFSNMYTLNSDFISFIAYIYCLVDKSKIKQSIFINIDKSGVGKTSKIASLILLGNNKIVDSRLLKKSELYNIANSNAIICNEIQNKSIDSSNLNNLADNLPLTVTRKSDFSIELKASDKPLIVLMGENMPLLKSLSNGSNRRFYLVPLVSNSYMEYMKKDYNKSILKEFFNILNNKPYTVLYYYISKIKEFNLIDENIFNNAIDNMKTDYKAISNLILSNDRIFNKYFNKYPSSKENITTDYYCIGINQSLNKLLEYIENKEFDSNKVLDIEIRKKQLFIWIKDNNDLKNIKQLGFTRISKNNNMEYLYYSVSLTEYGLKAIKQLNNINIKNMYF